MNEVLIISHDGSSRVDYLEPSEADAWRRIGCQVLPVEERLGDVSIHEVGAKCMQVSGVGNQIQMNISQD